MLDLNKFTEFDFIIFSGMYADNDYNIIIFMFVILYVDDEIYSLEDAMCFLMILRERITSQFFISNSQSLHQMVMR